MFPQNYHFLPGGSGSPHNIWFFGPTWVFIPMAFWSVQPVCRHTDHTTSVTLGHILMHCMRCNLITVTSGHDHIAIRHRSFNRFTRWHQSAPTWSWGLHISNGISTHSSIFAGLTLHIPYTVQEAARCPSKTAPSPGRGGSGPPHNEVVLPDISVARLAHRHTGHYSRALKWSKYIWTECNQSSDLDMQRVDPWLLVNTVTFPPVSFILNSSHTQTHTVIHTDCIASRHTATAESMGEASIQSNARISWNGTTATTTIIPV